MILATRRQFRIPSATTQSSFASTGRMMWRGNVSAYSEARAEVPTQTYSTEHNLFGELKGVYRNTSLGSTLPGENALSVNHVAVPSGGYRQLHTHDESGNRQTFAQGGSALTAPTVVNANSGSSNDGLFFGINSSSNQLTGVDHGAAGAQLFTYNDFGRADSDNSRVVHYGYNYRGQVVIEAKDAQFNSILRFFHYDGLGNLVGVENVGMPAIIDVPAKVYSFFLPALSGFGMGSGPLLRYDFDVGSFFPGSGSTAVGSPYVLNDGPFLGTYNFIGPNATGSGLEIVGEWNGDPGTSPVAHLRDFDGSLRELVREHPTSPDIIAEFDYDAFGAPIQRGVSWTNGKYGQIVGGAVEQRINVAGFSGGYVDLVHVSGGVADFEEGQVVVVYDEDTKRRSAGRVYSVGAMNPDPTGVSPTALNGILIKPDGSNAEFIKAWNKCASKPGGIYTFDDHIVDTVMGMGDFEDAKLLVKRYDKNGNLAKEFDYDPYDPANTGGSSAFEPMGSNETEDVWIRLTDNQRNFDYMIQQYRRVNNLGAGEYLGLMVENDRKSAAWNFLEFSIDWSKGPDHGNIDYGGVGSNSVYIYLGWRYPDLAGGAAVMNWYAPNKHQCNVPKDTYDLFEFAGPMSSTNSATGGRYTCGVRKRFRSGTHWTSTSCAISNVAYDPNTKMTKISVAQTPEMYFLPEYLDGTRVQLSLNLPAVQTITSIFRDDGTHTFGFYVAGNWSGAVHPSDRFIIFADTHVYHDTNPIQYTQHRPKIRDNLYAGYHYIDPAVGFVLTTTPVNASYGIVAVSNSINGWNHCGYYATGFRMYDPSVGRYLAPDLAGAPFWNSYHYANNNPLVYTDPSGLAAISGTAIAIGLIWAALNVGAGEGIAKLGQGENYEPSGWRMAGNGVASVIPGLGVARAAHKGWKGARLAVAAFGWGYAGEIAGQTVANKGEVSKVSWTGAIADTVMNLALGQAAKGIVRGVKHAGKLFGSVGGKLANTRVGLSIGRGTSSAYHATMTKLKLHCFPEGTLVHTESGLRPIEELEAGDLVWSVDPDSGKWSPQSVVEPLVNDYSGDLISITVAGETIEGTGGHPFLVLSGKELNARPFVEELHGVDACAIGRWVEARHIRIGDMLLLRSGQQVRVASLSSRQATLKVYNLHVGRQHTFAVGAAGVAVHNVCNGFRGGQYSQIRGRGSEGIDVHHLIPESVEKVVGSGVSKSKGTGIQMLRADHKKTRSYGGGRSAIDYRTRFAALNRRDQFAEAIRDVRRIHPTRYSKAIREALATEKSTGRLRKLP